MLTAHQIVRQPAHSTQQHRVSDGPTLPHAQAMAYPVWRSTSSKKYSFTGWTSLQTYDALAHDQSQVWPPDPTLRCDEPRDVDDRTAWEVVHEHVQLQRGAHDDQLEVWSDLWRGVTCDEGDDKQHAEWFG